MNKRKHAAHALYKAPATTPSLTRCLTIHLPDGDDWQLLFESAFSSLMTWINYQRSNTTRESEVAQVWREIFDSFDYGNCNTFEGVSLMPVGSVIPFAGQVVPAGWLNCDGELYLASDYPDLYAIIHPFFKYTIEGVEKFRTPDMIARSAIGHGTIADANRSSKSMGVSGGAETQVLTTANLAAHTHVQDAHNHTQTAHNHTQTAHTHVQDAHNHTQTAHNHTQDAHTHVQDAHNHTQTAHNHTQDAHTHTQVSHGHNPNQIAHKHGIPTVFGAAGVTSGYFYGQFQGTTSADTGTFDPAISEVDAAPVINPTTPTNNVTTAVNAATTATNQSTTPTNNATTAVNAAQTATNQNTTAVNAATTAVNAAQTATNQSAGGGTAHNNLSPYTSLWYIIKAVDDTITGTPGADGKLTMLRQNSTNRYHLEQSYNSGLDWSLAFDYSILKQKALSPSTTIEVVNTINITNNYINNINTVYDDDILNVYPDAVYDATEDDMLRDLTLCWTIREIARYLEELLGTLAEENEEPPTITHVIKSAAEVVGTGIAAFAAVFAAANTLNPILTVLTAFVVGEEFNNQLQELEDDWAALHADPSGFNDVDIDFHVCCLFSALQGVTLTETGWKEAFFTCLTPLPEDSIFETVFKLAFSSIGADDKLFAVWLDLLNTGFLAQQAGVVFDDCPCLVVCSEFDFENDGASGWVAGFNTSLVGGQGWRQTVLETSPFTAVCTYDLGELAFFKRIELTWNSPRNHANQFYRIEASEDNSTWVELKEFANQPVGKQTEFWTGTEYARYVRLTAAGSTVVGQKGWIYSALICYIPV